MTKYTPLLVGTKIAVTFQTSGAKRILFPVQKGLEHNFESIGFYFKESEALKAANAQEKIAVLTRALEFYAREDAWEGYEKDFGDGQRGYVTAPAIRDKGDFARMALKESAS